ncbi:MAG: MGMT family protein [Candidatus Omnitrophica bacterium]|nr:MGMT family protein [Candidatus Omnitrophota bacterium]
MRLDLCSTFQKEVLRAVQAIPRGKVSTYKLIAKQIGRPKAARAVGRALATNPFALVIPCHRVIRSDGSLGGYQGGTKMKQALLRKEARHEKD